MERISRFYELMGDRRAIITNKVYTAETQKLNLKSEKLLSISGYKPPQRFSGGVLRLPGATYLLFESGKVVINGVKTQPNVRAFTKVTNLPLINVKLSHCSASFNVGKSDLKFLREKIPKSMYEPELHHGLMFKIENVSVILQHTGVVLLCGLKNEEHMTEVESKIWEMINIAYGLNI